MVHAQGEAYMRALARMCADNLAHTQQGHSRVAQAHIPHDQQAHLACKPNLQARFVWPV